MASDDKRMVVVDGFTSGLALGSVGKNVVASGSGCRLLLLYSGEMSEMVNSV